MMNILEGIIYFIIALNVVVIVVMAIVFFKDLIKAAAKKKVEPIKKEGEPMKVGVAMIPTEKASHLYIQNDKLCYDETICEQIKDCGDQHLYLFSEEQIKAGDWMTDGSKIWHNKVQLDAYLGLYKIEATTDKSLIWSDEENGNHTYTYPQIPISFVKDYVDAKGNLVEANLETEYIGFIQTPMIKIGENNEVIIAEK